MMCKLNGFVISDISNETVRDIFKFCRGRNRNYIIENSCVVLVKIFFQSELGIPPRDPLHVTPQ